MKKFMLLITFVLLPIFVGVVLADEAPDLPCSPSSAEFHPSGSDSEYLILSVTCGEENFWFDILGEDHLLQIGNGEQLVSTDTEILEWNESSYYDGFLTYQSLVIWSGYPPISYHIYGQSNPWITLVLRVPDSLDRQVQLIHNGETYVMDGGRILDAAVIEIATMRRWNVFTARKEVLAVVRQTGEVIFLELPE